MRTIRIEGLAFESRWVPPPRTGVAQLGTLLGARYSRLKFIGLTILHSEMEYREEPSSPLGVGEVLMAVGQWDEGRSDEGLVSELLCPLPRSPHPRRLERLEPRPPAGTHLPASVGRPAPRSPTRSDHRRGLERLSLARPGARTLAVLPTLPTVVPHDAGGGGSTWASTSTEGSARSAQTVWRPARNWVRGAVGDSLPGRRGDPA